MFKLEKSPSVSVEVDAEEREEWARRAKEHSQNAEYTEAEYFFKKLTKVDQENWEAWYGRGLCHKALEQYTTALHCFKQVTELKSEFAKGWYHQGFVLIQLDEEEEAIFNLNRALKIKTDYSMALGIKAWIFYSRGDIKNAEKLLDRMIEKNPGIVDKLKKFVDDADGVGKDARTILDLYEELKD